MKHERRLSVRIHPNVFRRALEDPAVTVRSGEGACHWQFGEARMPLVVSLTADPHAPWPPDLVQALDIWTKDPA